MSRLVHGLILPEDAKKSINIKQGASKDMAMKAWSYAKSQSASFIGNLSPRDNVIILAALYWGEGSKKEFNIINSDPQLLKIVVESLKILGVPIDDIKIGIRLYNGISKLEAVDFWSETLSIPITNIAYFEHVRKNGENKFKFGMCRVRVRKGAPIFKFIMSVIDLIKRY